jgi:4-amino-4-deoxy-L-arabinose transferase-like glycosyltransferase
VRSEAQVTAADGSVARRRSLRPSDRLSTPEQRRTAAVLAAIMAVGLAIRIAFVAFKQWDMVLNGDAGFYAMSARLIDQGKGFINPYLYYDQGLIREAADHPPGFIVFLLGLRKLGILDPNWQRIVLCFVGTLTIPVVFAVGRRIGGRTVGLVAAGVAAVYPNIWINDGMLMVETPFILAVALSLLFVYRLIERSSWWDVAGLSVSLTVALSVRPEVGVVFPFFVAPFLLTRSNAGSWRRRIATVALAAVFPIAAFTPWVVFNLGRFENPVYLSTGFGQTLANANCDQTYYGDFLGYYKMTCIHDLVGGVEAYMPYDQLDGSVRDARLGEVAKEYILDHKSQLPKVIAARIGRIWGVFRPGQSIVNDGWVEGRAGGSQTTDFTITREALWSYWVLGALAIGGLVLMRRRRMAPIYPLLVQPAIATVAAVLNSGITRYRAGAELTIVLGSAVAIVAIARWMFADRPGPSPADDADGRGDPPAEAPRDAGDAVAAPA